MPDMKEINAHMIAEFRANDGALSGPMAGAPVLLLTTTGRCSGENHTTPVGFIDIGGKLAIAAANGGADVNPDWYRNLRANPHVTIEVPGASIPSIARTTEGAERTEILDKIAQALPGMSDHLAAASREIPVVVITEREITGIASANNEAR